MGEHAITDDAPGQGCEGTPPESTVAKILSWMRSHLPITIIAGLTFMGAAALLSGCGGTSTAHAVTAARYSSVQQIVTALKHGHLPCVRFSSSNPPVAAGAMSEASCDVTAPGANFIDVFPNTITTTMVLKNSISTGTTEIWNVVGPNWQVQTTKPYAKRIQKILGGKIIPGPWRTVDPQYLPGAASSAAGPFSSWSRVCQRVASDIEAVGYTYSDGNWNIAPGTITYGQMQKLASKLAHLSYLSYHNDGDAQTANDLGNASTGFFKYLPAAAYNNAKYHHVMQETASYKALHSWDRKYLLSVLNDCANGGG